jgi:A/G-specific adenine glycosylase
MDMGGRFKFSSLELEKLSGFGQYVTNAALLLSGTEPAPLLDEGMARVIERCFGRRKLADIRYDPYLQDLARAVVAEPDAIRKNWAILDIAALICRPRNPKCSICPVVSICKETHTRQVELGCSGVASV